MTGLLSLRGGAARMMADNRVRWDTDDPDSLAICEAIWRESATVGFAFYSGETLTDLPRSEVTRGFDPSTAPRETIIVAPMAGG